MLLNCNHIQFIVSSPILPVFKKPFIRESASPRQHQPAGHLTNMAPPYHHTLSPAHMVEVVTMWLRLKVESLICVEF